jgi:hypothetical protein
MGGSKMAVIRAICDHAAAKAQMAKSEAILGLHRITPGRSEGGLAPGGQALSLTRQWIAGPIS